MKMKINTCLFFIALLLRTAMAVAVDNNAPGVMPVQLT